jgi:hypothetical protein
MDKKRGPMRSRIFCSMWRDNKTAKPRKLVTASKLKANDAVVFIFTATNDCIGQDRHIQDKIIETMKRKTFILTDLTF